MFLARAHFKEGKQRFHTLARAFSSAGFHEQWLEHLGCPITKEPLVYDADKQELVSMSIGVAYPIIDGTPHLMPPDARFLTEKEKKAKGIEDVIKPSRDE